MLLVKLHVFIEQSYRRSDKYAIFARSLSFLLVVGVTRYAVFYGVHAMTEILFDEHRRTLSNLFAEHDQLTRVLANNLTNNFIVL